jgi:hypothetical protein
VIWNLFGWTFCRFFAAPRGENRTSDFSGRPSVSKLNTYLIGWLFGNVAFLMKDVVLFAVSVYLLKQDVERVLSEDSDKAVSADSAKA